MRVDYSPRAARALTKAPTAIRKTLYKQLAFLLRDLHHPSLRAKKYDEAQDLWQARVNDDWRFYFKIVGDVYRLEEIRKHPK
jgi:mRNA interferase RelE/StbE